MPVGLKAGASNIAFHTGPPRFEERASCLSAALSRLGRRAEDGRRAEGGSSFTATHDHGWLSCEQREDSLIWLVGHAGSCRHSEPSGPLSLPGRSHVSRVLSALLAAGDRSVLSNQA